MMLDVVSKFSNTVRLHLPLSTKQAGPVMYIRVAA